MKEEPSKEGSLRSQAHGAVLQLLNGLGENLKDVLLLIDVPEETVERIFSSEASNGNNIELQKFLSTMVHNNKKEDWIILKSALGVIKEHIIASRLDDIIEGKSESVQVKDVISELLNKLGGSWRFFLRLVSIPEKIVRTISPNEMSDRNGRLYKLVAEKLREEKQTNRKQIEKALILLEKNNLAEKYKHMMACVVFDESKEDLQEAENEKKTEADDLSELINGLCGDWKVFLRLIDMPERTVISITESEKKSRHEKLYNFLAEKLLKIDEKCQKQVENMLKLMGKNKLIPILQKMNPRFIQDSNEDPIFELLKGLEEDLQFFLELIDIPEEKIDSIVLKQSSPEGAKEFVNIMQPWNEADFRKMESALILMHKYEMSSKIEAIKDRNFRGSNSSDTSIEEKSSSNQIEEIPYDKCSFTSSDTSIEKEKLSEKTSYSSLDIHQTVSSKMVFIGHPLQRKPIQIDKKNLEIPVNIGSNTTRMIHYQDISEWLETKELYFGVLNLFKDKIVFNFHDLKENCPILNTFEQLINDTGGNGFATKGYHLVDHLKLFDQQFFLNDKNFENYFCFLGNENITINFTKCGKEPGHALHYSSQNIQIMNALHKELQSKDITQVNVLVHNEDDSVDFCRRCLENNLFIKEDILTDIEKFKAWFRKLESLLYLLRKRMNRSTSSDETVLDNIKKDIITYEALLNSGSFPTFSNLPEDQMDEMPKIIFLTAIQFAILHGNNRHIILRGPYGSGKSIILRKKLDQCIQSMSEKELLYYICHDQQSKFLDFMRTIKEEHQSKSIVICSSKDMFFAEKPTLSSILGHILHFWRDKKVHIFIDEFSGSFITRKEILKLEGILPKFSNSNIVLSLQSMEEIVHEDMWNDIDLGFQYDLLEKKTSFVVYNLDYSLRCSAEINEFVKVTSKFIEVNEKCYTKIEIFFDNENRLFVDKELGLERNSQILENGAIETKRFYNISSRDGHSSYNGPVSIYSYDQFKANRRRHIFFKGSMVCHNFILIPIYITTLEYIINNVSSNEKFVVCTFDKYLYNCIYNHFDNSNLYIWTSDVSRFIQAKAEFNILLTDYASVRGYEFSNFVFLLPMGTKYLKYRMIECFTRATTKLHIITDNAEVSESSLDNKLIKLWKKLRCVEYLDCKYDQSKDTLKIVQDGNTKYSKNEISNIQVDRCYKFPWSYAREVPKEDEDFKDPNFIIDGEYLGHYPIPFDIGLHETLCYICETDNTTIFQEFIQLNKIDVQGYRGGYVVSENLLHISACKGSFNITQFLISGKHFDIESRGKFGQTPLHCAVEGGHVKVYNY